MFTASIVQEVEPPTFPGAINALFGGRFARRLERCPSDSKQVMESLLAAAKGSEADNFWRTILTPEYLKSKMTQKKKSPEEIKAWTKQLRVYLRHHGIVDGCLL